MKVGDEIGSSAFYPVSSGFEEMYIMIACQCTVEGRPERTTSGMNCARCGFPSGRKVMREINRDQVFETTERR